LWTKDPLGLEKANKVASSVVYYLEKIRKPIQIDYLEKEVGEENSPVLFCVLEASKKVKMGPYGLWGLSHWPEIHPRGTKDKIYIVLKQERNPLHFTQIARIINESGLFEDKKKIHPQTAHNELIKHPEFVLVGRGTYGLKEWGLEPGTVSDTIKFVLSKKGPLTREELIKQVLEQRMVKRNTILLNLRKNKNIFKNEKGEFELENKRT